MNLLEKFLKKVGVTEFSQLTEEEKETYRNWDSILSGRKLTDEEVATFLTTELEETVQKVIDQKLTTREDIFLKMKLDFIRKIQGFLNVPKVEKKILEQNINQL